MARYCPMVEALIWRCAADGFKRFADIDAIDLEVDTEDMDAFVGCVRLLGPSSASAAITELVDVRHAASAPAG